METRIYVVKQTHKPDRLIEATTPAQAIRHCVRPEFQAHAATPKEVASLLSGGHKIENAIEQETSSQAV